MRAVTPSFCSILLVAVSALSFMLPQSLALEFNVFGKAIEVIPDFDNTYMHQGTFPDTLADMLQGRRGSPLNFNRAAVEIPGNDYRPWSAEDFMNHMFDTPDNRQIFILGPPDPRDYSKAGASAAVYLSTARQGVRDDHLVGFMTVHHFPDSDKTLVRLNSYGFARKAPYLGLQIAQLPRVPPTFASGSILTPRQFFTGLHQGKWDGWNPSSS